MRTSDGPVFNTEGLGEGLYCTFMFMACVNEKPKTLKARYFDPFPPFILTEICQNEIIELR